MTPQKMDVPASIARFQVQSVIGPGGMGCVYKAFDPKLDRTVAVKTVRPDIVHSDLLARMYREAKACARLQHPNIVTIFEVGEFEGGVYIAMEYVKGESLAALLCGGAMSFDMKVRALLQILEALQHAHTANVIHRDVKPNNVIVQPDGSIKLFDFGIAQIEREPVTALTATGAMIGTPHYASPEQLRGEHVDCRTDIYSAGALAYELFSGRRAFDSPAMADLLLAVVCDAPPPMDDAWSRLFPALEGIVSRAMAKSPDQRYQSAAEMRDAVADFWLTAEHDVARIQRQLDVPRDKPWSPGFRRWAAAMSAVVFLMIGVGIWKWELVPGTASGLSDYKHVDLSQPSPLRSHPIQPRTLSPAIQALPLSSRELTRTDLSQSPSEAAEPLPATPSAKRLYARTDNRVSANTGLKYRLIHKRGSAEIDADPDATFHSGDSIKFVFESNVDGFLYVAQKGSTGRWTILFPHPDTNGGENTITAAREDVVPDEGWFAFDDTPGNEEIFIVLSKEKLESLPGFGAPVRQLESVSATVVDNVLRTVQSRDLVFQKDRSGQASQSNYVVNRNELGRHVAAVVSLTHLK